MARVFRVLAMVMMIAGCASDGAPPVPTDQRAAGDRVTGHWFSTRSPVLAQNAMAATSQPLATQVALDILKAGGTAVDAAIAANAAIGLMEPTGNGIGGDLFAMVWDPETERLYGLNAAGKSPMGLSLETVRANADPDGTLPSHGVIPVSVPGAVDGWFALHDRFGKLEMGEILAPAITYAEDGFPVTEVIAYYWDLSAKGIERRAANGEIAEIENARATYWPDGPPAAGEVFKNPDLAQTYRAIARGGRDAFYDGELAAVMDAYMARIGGYMTAKDLAAHASEWVDPVSVDYRGHRVHELPPPGQGVAALQILQILEGFDLTDMGFGSAESLHLQIEAKRLAFEDRAKYYADPDFSPAPIAGLTSDDYAAERRSLIDLSRAHPMVGPGDPAALEDGDTIYLTVADASGMMVSLIQSNYRGMGSGLVPDGLGFMLQNRGELFSLEDGHANIYAPGKRPFHTIIPAFVTKDGQPVMSFGLMGGGMQPQGHAQIIVNMVDYGMNVQEAGDAPRWRHDGSSEPTGPADDAMGVVYLESGYSDEVAAALEALGHRVVRGDGGFGGYQAITRDPDTGVYAGASEMRKDGQAAGY